MPAQPPLPPFVLKYGGNAMVDADVRQAVAAGLRELARGGRPPVVVHGGGPFIAAALERAGVASRFVRGLRVTSDAAMPIVERTLTSLGKELAALIGSGVGLTGRDAGLLRAAAADPELGRVGRAVRVEPRVIHALLRAGLVPVIGCVALDDDGDALNVNADDVAGAVAGTLGVPALFMTNVAGVLDDPGDPDSLLPSIRRAEVLARIEDGRIAGGMIPKLEAALAALDAGAPHARIVDGRDARTAPALLRRAASGDLTGAGAEIAIGTRIDA